METVREMRDRLGISVQEAKTIVRQERLTRQINEAKSIDDLKPILLDLLTHKGFF